MTSDQLDQLKKYFTQHDGVILAFVFGSWAKRQARMESDADVAVYLVNEKAVSQSTEAGCLSRAVQDIWGNLESIIAREVDLIVLNDAAPSVALSALQGIPMVIKDRRFYLDFLLRTTAEAADFREWLESYWRLKQRDFYGTPA